MREEFEKLPEIARIIKEHDAFYCNKGEWYLCPDDDQFAEAYLDGAWYAYQEQQKKIDKHNAKLQKFIDELTKTEQDDKDNKIEFWRGFAECAGSARDVFLRDVGELK